MVSGVRCAWLVLIAGLLCASACVTFSVSPSTAPPSPTGSIRPVSAGKGFGLIPDQDGQVVMVDADTDIIRLVLDDGWTWTVTATFIRAIPRIPHHAISPEPQQT